ncbi:MAG: DMT family transporter [Anaerolineaceae bacterium]|nr:DMT family transporter [Anaerolineaceae bacterium]
MRKAWVYFWLLGLIWGSSFLFIRIAVENHDLRPVEVVFIRTAIAAVGLGAVIAWRRVPLPRTRRMIIALAVVGLGNVVAPFMLITWGEQFIPSSIAAVLQSTAALFALVVAHFMFTDERMTSKRVLGLMVGFVGVIVLFGDKLGQGTLNSGFAGQVAIVVASMCYAFFTGLGRKIIQSDVQPIVVAFGTMVTAAVTTAPFVFFTEGGFTPLLHPLPVNILLTVVLLGFFNTFIAYIFFYEIVRALGASRAAMVTYIVPAVGLILGWLVLGESIGITLLLGGTLIMIGIAIVNLRPSQVYHWLRLRRATNPQ